MGLRDWYDHTRQEIADRLEKAREAHEQGSDREAINELRGGAKNNLAPAPTNGKCANHACRPEKKGFFGHAVDQLATPLLFAALWKKLVLEPDYIFPCSDPGPVLQHPKAYGLDNFVEVPIISYKTDKETGKKIPTQKLMAWYAAPSKPGFPTLAYCHGTSGALDARRMILQEFNDAGFGVMIVANPGYKGSKVDCNGNPQEASERGFVTAAKAMYKMLRKDNPDTNIVFLGESLGGAVAMKATREIEQGIPNHHIPGQKVAATECFAAFTSLPDRVREDVPILPAESFMDIVLDAKRVIGKIKAPVTLFAGTEDETTCHHHSDRLKKAGGDNVEVVHIPGANHRLTKPRPPGVPVFALVSDSKDDKDRLEIDPIEVRRFIRYMKKLLEGEKIDRVHAEKIITHLQEELDCETIGRGGEQRLAGAPALADYTQKLLESPLLGLDSKKVKNLIDCVQASLDPDMFKIDREQVRNLIAYVQSSLHKKGLCPAPERPPGSSSLTIIPIDDPDGVPGDSKWENRVAAAGVPEVLIA